MQTTINALKLLNEATNSRLDIWNLAGPYNAARRAQIMSALMGAKVPQSKAGVNAIQDELHRRLSVKGNCIAARDDDFLEKARDILMHVTA